jgi:formate/nitrite transporter FocA (FNT family)
MGRATWRSTGASRSPGCLNLFWVFIGNLIGSLSVAYFLAKETGVVTAPAPLERLGAIATAKGHTETDWQIFLRAMGCNWLVFARAGDSTWADTLKNWLFAFLGNFVGAAIFVSTTYWYLYLREPVGTAKAGGGEQAVGDDDLARGDGRRFGTPARPSA